MVLHCGETLFCFFPMGLKPPPVLPMDQNPFSWSESEISFLLGSSSDLLWRLDPQFRFVEVKSLEGLVHGYRPEELLGQPISLVMSPRSIQKVGQLHALRMEQEARGEATATAWLEVEIISKTGEMAWAEVRSTAIRDQDANITGYIGVTREITARKMVEDALRESEARYRGLYDRALAQEEVYKSLLNSIPHPVVLYTLDGETVSINPSFTEVFGFTPEDVAGKRIPFVPPEEAARSFVEIGNVLSGRPSLAFETRRLTKDGRTLDTLISSSVYLDHEGVPAGIVVILQDITTKNLAQRRLKASEQKFSDIFAHAPLLMTVTNPDDGGFADANDRFCEVSGFSREELMGRTSVELGWLKADDRARIIKKLHAEGRFRDEEVIATAKDGHKVHCLYSGELIVIDGVRKLLAMALDITEKKTLEEELDKAQRLEALGVLAGGLAHDFNNILTGILGSVSLAQTMIDPDNQVNECLEKCEKAALRASQLVGQLLTFAKGGEPVKKVIRLGPLLEEAVSFALRGSSISSELSVEEGLSLIEADEGQLSQTLNNLLINAAQAMPEGGTVKVRAGNLRLGEHNSHFLEPGDYISITVADTGTGIPKSNLKKIFDPYFTTKEMGTGLGLSTVYSIVKRHKGFVGVESAPGEGSVFTVILPASKEPLKKLEQPPNPATGKGHGRVLVMDDDPLIRELALIMLAKAGYEAEVAAEGGEAIDMVLEAQERGSPFDAAILDLTIIGGMGGKETAQRLNELCPSLPLVASSGYSNSPVMADCKSHGFTCAMAKPYKYGDLAKCLAQLLSRG